MTQPPYPGQTGPGQPAGTPAAGSGYGQARFDRTAATRAGAAGAAGTDKGQFSYETISNPRPSGPGAAGAANGAPADGSAPVQTLPPPAPAGYRSGSAAPGAPGTAVPGPPAPAGSAPAAPGGRVRAAARAAASRGPRRARLQVRHINPWTVFKFACVLAVALFFIWLLTVAALYGVLEATGVVSRINDAVTTINGDGSAPPVRPSLVFVGAIVIGAINIVLFIALATIGSIVYNLCADLIGGIEVTLSEREA